MLEPLCRTLRRTSCSGAFVLLDATINSHLAGAEPENKEDELPMTD